MKTRQGFVSNSSVSSFILIVEKEAYDKILPTLSPFVKAVVKQVSEKMTCLGKVCMVISDVEDMGGEGYLSNLEVEFKGSKKKNTKKKEDEDGDDEGEEDYEEDDEDLGDDDEENYPPAAVEAYREAVEKAFPKQVFYKDMAWMAFAQAV